MDDFGRSTVRGPKSDELLNDYPRNISREIRRTSLVAPRHIAISWRCRSLQLRGNRAAQSSSRFGGSVAFVGGEWHRKKYRHG